MEAPMASFVDAGELASCGIVIVSADLGHSTAGSMWCELGMALGANKECHIVAGRYELPIFQHSPMCMVWGDWKSLSVSLGAPL
jgi:hypothetical protein